MDRALIEQEGIGMDGDDRHYNGSEGKVVRALIGWEGIGTDGDRGHYNGSEGVSGTGADIKWEGIERARG